MTEIVSHKQMLARINNDCNLINWAALICIKIEVKK